MDDVISKISSSFIFHIKYLFRRHICIYIYIHILSIYVYTLYISLHLNLDTLAHPVFKMSHNCDVFKLLRADFLVEATKNPRSSLSTNVFSS